jgi:hypothetical protein
VFQQTLPSCGVVLEQANRYHVSPAPDEVGGGGLEVGRKLTGKPGKGIAADCVGAYDPHLTVSIPLER